MSTRLSLVDVVRGQRSRPANVGSRGVTCWRPPTTDSVFPEPLAPSNGLFFRVTVILASPEPRPFERSDVRQILTSPYCQQESAQPAGRVLLLVIGISRRCAHQVRVNAIKGDRANGRSTSAQSVTA